MRRRRGAWLFGAAHDERERDQQRGNPDHHPDDIDIGQQKGLNLGHAVDLRAGVMQGAGKVWRLLQIIGNRRGFEGGREAMAVSC